MASSDYRLVVREGRRTLDTFDRESYSKAYEGWAQLTDYGKDAYTYHIERYIGGTWVEVDPDTGEVQVNR